MEIRVHHLVDVRYDNASVLKRGVVFLNTIILFGIIYLDITDGSNLSAIVFIEWCSRNINKLDQFGKIELIDKCSNKTFSCTQTYCVVGSENQTSNKYIAEET